MSVDLQKCFERGGARLLHLLDYCVRSREMAPVFLFLVQEYRRAPTAEKAVALYEVFCLPNAPARLDVPVALPPRSLSIQNAIRPFRTTNPPVQASAPEGRPARGMLLPPKYLFDFISDAVARASPGLKRVSKRYKPSRSPMENLPGGQMSIAQRYFVEKVWEPSLRPLLVSAGFWRMATIA